MKKWLVLLTVAVILAITPIMLLPKEAKAGVLLDDLEFIHSINIGMADYKFYNCSPDCGAAVAPTGIWGMSETLYYTGFKKVHPGIQAGFTQTVSMHIHTPGNISDRLYYGLVMVRVPVKKINFYAGAGLGSQFTEIVTNGEPSECNHGALVAKAGAEYMITKRIGLGVEYLFAKTHHDFEDHGQMGDEGEIKLKQNTHSAMAVLAFHF